MGRSDTSRPLPQAIVHLAGLVQAQGKKQQLDVTTSMC